MTPSHCSPTLITTLSQQGCTAQNWDTVYLPPDTDTSRFRNVSFIGEVSVGIVSGSAEIDGVLLPCGIYNAVISNCRIGDRVRIARIGSVVSNYVIEDNTVIEDVSSLSADDHPACGIGTDVGVVNEAGGRMVTLTNGLTAQTAYMQAMMLHNGAFTNALSSLIKKFANGDAPRARVCAHARIMHCGTIHNVTFGPHAHVHGALHLENGTINSCAEHPSEIGSGVHARSFVLSEGALVESGALLENVFVGQGARLGKQFSAENSVFFANSEGYHGEAVSLFAGPYTVTHHKSTLLIAGLFSFYNAGSGSNQSNHMYKLGPVHQGVFERGCKTGSFSYVLLESHIGAFSVIIGKHFTNIETPNLPFSYIHDDQGVSKIIPGMTLFSVGTVRDGEKWPKRDNRKSPLKRDLIVFDVFSPYSVEKMRRGRSELLALSENTPKEKAFVLYGGLQLNRLLLRKGAKYYSMAIARYLNEKVCSRIHELLLETRNWDSVRASLAPSSHLTHASEWMDLCGLLTPSERVQALEEKIASGALAAYENVVDELKGMYGLYRQDEWQYVVETFEREYSLRLQALTREQALSALEEWYKSAVSLHSMILEDSKREFGAFAKIGYGIGQSGDLRDCDFTAVRGSGETNSVVQKLVREADEIQRMYTQYKDTFITS